MDPKKSGSSRNRSKSQGKSSGAKRFAPKTEPEKAHSLARRFLRFFGFGKPEEPAKSSTRGKKREIQEHPVTSERLFVGNLSYSVKEDELSDLFAKAGKVVKAEVVTNRKTQRSKGYGFVTMASIEEAERAVSQLDGTRLKEREIAVSGAKSAGQKDTRPARKKAPPKKSQEPRERGDSRPRSDRNESSGRKEGRRGRGPGRERDGRERGRKGTAGPTVVPMQVEEVSTHLLLMSNLSEDFGEEELEHLFAGVARVTSSKIAEGKANIEMASVEDAQTAVRLLHGKDFMGKTLSLSGKSAD